MSMMHITICDDEKAEIEYLAALAHKWAQARGVLIRLSHYQSAESFLFHYDEDKDVDILLLDIQMKAMDGVTLARTVRQDNDGVQIIFITGYPDFIAEGYDVSALHYLMKPVKEHKLFEVLDKAVKQLNRADKSLFLSAEGDVHRIPFKDIRYIEVQGHYIKINTAAREYRTKMNLSELQKFLDDSFFRCQRSFIVNLRYVRRITRAAIVLDDTTEVPLSRDLYAAANQAVITFFPQ